jgi:hypothetical protein
MLKIIGIAVAVLVGLVVAFVVWRIAATIGGARKRDEKLFARIDPVARRLEAGEAVSQQEIEALAERPELRHMLHAALRHAKRADLVPARYAGSAEQGSAALAYWMMHPNELQDAPAAIELVETLRRPVAGRDAEFHVYRYRMAEGHRAAKDGWILGVAGPMKDGAEPYAELPGAFSRAGDSEGKVQPAELVDWYVGMLRQKG